MKWVGSALVYVGLPLLLAELTEVAPWLAARLLRWATRALPAPHRSRYEQEWLAELDAVPGKLLKLLFAGRIAIRIPATRRELERAQSMWAMAMRWLLQGIVTAARSLARRAGRLRTRLAARPSRQPASLDTGASLQRWRITGSATGFVPATPVTVYVDGKKAAILPGHSLDHFELMVAGQHPPRTITLTGSSGPGEPPPSSSCSLW